MNRDLSLQQAGKNDPTCMNVSLSNNSVLCMGADVQRHWNVAVLDTQRREHASQRSDHIGSSTSAVSHDVAMTESIEIELRVWAPLPSTARPVQEDESTTSRSVVSIGHPLSTPRTTTLQREVTPDRQQPPRRVRKRSRPDE